MKVVFFPSITNIHGEAADIEWVAFGRGYLQTFHSQLIKDGPLYSGAIYESGHIERCDTHCIARTAIVFDFDNKGCPVSLPEDHFDNLGGLTYAWHSTWSSRPEHPKWRLVLPLDRAVSRNEWDAIYRGAYSLIGADPAVDGGSADWSRAYYRPAYHPAHKDCTFCGFQDGNRLSADELLDMGGQGKIVDFKRPDRPLPATIPLPPAQGRYDGRNDAMKAQVAACLDKGLSLDKTVAELISYDNLKNTPPLFTDPSENRNSTDGYSNALRFVSSVVASINSRRKADGKAEQKFCDPDPAESSELKTIRVSTLADHAVPEREWLIPDWIPMKQTTALYGTGGIGKTLIAQQIMTCVCTGIEFFGMGVKKGPVLGIFCEDSVDELHIRQNQINNAYAINWRDLSDMHIASRIGEDNLYITYDKEHGDGELSIFWKQVMEAAATIKPALLVTDTAADTFGGNENNRSQVRQYIQRCLAHIAISTGCAHLLCAHPSVSGINATNDAIRGSGGSTAWNNSVRSRLYMSDDENQGVVLECIKSNYAKKGSRIELVWTGGAYVERVNYMVPGGADPASQCDQDFVRMLMLMKEQGVEVGTSNKGSYAPSVFVKSGKIHGMNWTAKQYEMAMYRLLNSKVIRNESKRSNSSKDGFRLVITGDSE